MPFSNVDVMIDGLYPLKFETIFKEKLWGGQKIKTVLGKNFDNLNNCGETWELSGVKGNISKAINGPLKGELLTHLMEKHHSGLVGKKVYEHYGNEFPLLIKFIDAAQDLSIQVHPDDALARKRHNGFGKTEMWYIMQADEDATLITGFNRNTNKEEYQEYVRSGKLNEILNREKAEKGDVFFLPAGRVHTIGKGLMLAEIQQTSDITYRIYDFDRVDKQGKKRELHIEEALEAIDFNYYTEYKTPYTNHKNTTNEILRTPFFTTNKLNLDRSICLERAALDCFKIYIGINGQGLINGEPIKMGEVMLVPAVFKNIEIEPEGKLEMLETYIQM